LKLIDRVDVLIIISHNFRASLALGKKITLEEEVAVKDPFNVKSGGMVNMQMLKAGKLKTASDDAYGNYLV
jgi:hypothetical protein